VAVGAAPRLRDQRLRALLRTAKARSPWHAKRLAGVDVDAVTGADLAALPTMTKTDVMEHCDEVVTDRRLTLELAEAHLERVAAEGPAYPRLTTARRGPLVPRHAAAGRDRGRDEALRPNRTVRLSLDDAPPGRRAGARTLRISP
jgi:hypothetical protein